MQLFSVWLRCHLKLCGVSSQKEMFAGQLHRGNISGLQNEESCSLSPSGRGFSKQN